MQFKDQAVCIRLIDWSETSQIVSLLTEHHGKLRGLAKGSKRSSPGSVARFCGGIELLTLGQVVGITRPTSQLATVTEWDLQEPYWHLRGNLRALHMAMYGADLAGALVADQEPHPGSFAALVDLLAQLADPTHHECAVLGFQWRLLEDCGYRPQLDHDVRTGQPLAASSAGPPKHTPPRQKPYLFDPRAGGLTAPSSGPDNGCWRVRPATVALLHRVATVGRVDPKQGTEPNENIDRANRLLCAYARAILDRELPTMHFVLESKR